MVSKHGRKNSSKHILFKARQTRRRQDDMVYNIPLSTRHPYKLYVEFQYTCWTCSGSFVESVELPWKLTNLHHGNKYICIYEYI